MKFALAFAISAALLSAGTAANAIELDDEPAEVFSSYRFTGFCIDCRSDDPEGDNSPRGLLTLRNYTVGDELEIDNFVRFEFTSSNFPNAPFVIDFVTDISGSLSTLPGANTLSFRNFNQSFESDADEAGS